MKDYWKVRVPEQWEESFNELRVFIATHGRWPGYKREDEPNEKRLNKWCQTQRFMHAKGLLRPEWFSRLEEISFFEVFERKDVKWMKRYEVVKAFYDVHQRLPYRAVAPEIELWLDTQASRYNLLDGWKKKLLGQINFLRGIKKRKPPMIVVYNPVWERVFALVCDYHIQHGKLPSRKDDRKLFAWLNTQRQMIKKNVIPADRAAMLAAAGFDIMEGTYEVQK